MLTFGSLFAGIGGFDLGLERAGMRGLWQVEREPFCRAVLERHFPDARRYDDVCTVGAHNLQPVDLICGGFPCQDVSVAGRGAGIEGERSGLWGEYARLVGELRPRYVVVENVSALLGRGLSVVLGDLSALGYDAEWDCLPASAFGAPHRRDRLWLVAYPNQERRDGRTGELRAHGRDEPAHRREDVADAPGERREPGVEQGTRRHPTLGSSTVDQSGGCGGASGAEWWAIEPDVGRMAHGVPARMDRLSALGNALVPQIAEWIGRRILQWEGDLDAAA